MRTLKSNIWVLLIMISSVVVAQDFTSFDGNSDGMLDQDEFNGAFETTMGEWDNDGDELLSDDEFYDNTFGSIDLNDDESITETEWNEGDTNIFGDHTDEDFATFDSDGDGIINNDEWKEGFGNSNWFNSYDGDQDGFLNNDEFNNGLFNDWDDNLDGMLDETEFSSRGSFFNQW